MRRERLPDARAALEAVEAFVRTQRLDGRRGGVDLRYRRWEPEEVVAARLEVRGPGAPWRARRAGVDVRADGSLEAWLGLVAKRRLEPREDETLFGALRRELDYSTSSAP